MGKLGGRDSCEEGGRTGEIKMQEDKLESNRAQNIISKVRLSLNIRSEMDAWLHRFCKYTQRNIYFAVPSLYLCIITKQNQMPG